MFFTGGENPDSIFHISSTIDGYELSQEDMNEMAEMQRLDLPVGFQFGNIQNDPPARLKTKVPKQAYWCDICMIELQSTDTMSTHMNGSKHMKKQLSLASSSRSGPVVVPIPTPAPTRNKQPIRLHEKIRQTTQFIVGLRFVKEVIAFSNSEMEPYYECRLCGSQGQSNCMFAHLVGQQHRQNYVEHLYPNDQTKLSLSQLELSRIAEELDEKNDAIESLIVIKNSDDEYPWTAGMEPWLIENGGTGIIPDGARNNFDSVKSKVASRDETAPATATSFATIDVKPDQKIKGKDKFKIPDPDLIKPPNSRDEALKMLEMGKRLIIAGTRASLGSGSPLANLLEATILAAEMKLLSSSSRRSPNVPHTRSPSSSSQAVRVDRRSRTPNSSREDFSYNHYKRRRSNDYVKEEDRGSYKRRSVDSSVEAWRGNRSYDYSSREGNRGSHNRDNDSSSDERGNSYKRDYDHYSRSNNGGSYRKDYDDSSRYKRRGSYERSYDEYERERGGSSRRYDNKEPIRWRQGRGT